MPRANVEGILNYYSRLCFLQNCLLTQYIPYNVVGAEEYNSGEGSADDVMAVAVDDYTFEVTLKVADPTFESKLVAPTAGKHDEPGLSAAG